MKYILSMAIMLTVCACTRVIVPTTPEGKACSTTCDKLMDECSLRCYYRDPQWCGMSCSSNHQQCLLTCPGAYEK